MSGGLIRPYKGIVPKPGRDVFIAETAALIGDVVIGDESNIWYGVVMRGDVHEIRVGARTNIQDGTIVHVTSGRFGTYIGSDVTIGHAAILHACTLGDVSFVGMGATVMDGAVVEDGSMVAAGALVTPGKRVKSGELWAGSPAKLMRTLSEDDLKAFKLSADHYVKLASEYLRG
jgi:carbonic anhydrase/acetyltransferase-like protein (isoleucine patch superfamily)